MKQKLLFIFALLPFVTTAQTFTGSGGAIPDAGPQVSFPITVSGLTPASVDTVYGLETVCLSLTHTWDADLTISLQSPDGTIIDLSVNNGGDGDDYTNTCFNGFGANSIATSGAPFTGTFRPQSFLGTVNNGQNGNGDWKLLIQDGYPADAGTLLNWSITFGSNPALPFNFNSSNLPIVVINTGGRQIPNEPKIAAYMGIIDNGTGVRNQVTDPFNTYRDSIGIELRGSSSQSFPQKQYGIETRDINGVQKDTIVMGMPKQHDWILYAPYDDKTCMRNVLSYDIANKTGHYASRTRYCEVLLNGQYQGIYVMMEKIKRDNNRVNVSKLQPTDISGDDVTGGYIFKIDRDDGPGSYWTSAIPTSSSMAVNFVYVYPKTEDIVTQQKDYIKSYVDSFEVALNGPDFSDPSIGFRNFADENSFIDYFILDEISKNVDGYRLSTFLYKDKNSKGGKITIGPAWDYNLAWWNADYCNGNVSSGWAYQLNDICGGSPNDVPFWWARLLQDTDFKNNLKCRWTQLRASTLSTVTLNNYVDSIAAYLNEAQNRHFTAWPILGTYTWPNPSPIPSDYPGEIAALKTWILDRVTWMDANMPGTCLSTGIAENPLSAASSNVYPNPFTGDVSVNFYLTHPDNVKIELSDLLGKTVKTVALTAYPEGDNTVALHFPEGELKAGVYLMKISTSTGMVAKKLSKVD